MAVPTLCPILVGRDSELEFLHGARKAGGGVVVVSGEAGIGKSRLLREFAELAIQDGASVVWGRPEVVSEPGPYSLIIDLLADVGAGRSAVSPEVDALMVALAGTQPGRELPPARQIAARTRGLIAELPSRPVVVLEDLHAADEPSQAVIAHLARSAFDDGTLILGAVRSEEELTPGTARLLDVLNRDRLASRLELTPLNRAALKEMLSAMWDDEPSEEELETISELGEGIPFFTEELGAVRRAGKDVPLGIATGIAARLSRLSPDARRVVQAAALAAGAVDPRILALATGIPEDRVPPCLVEGMRTGLLADREGRIVYRHGLLRDAVAASLVSIERRRLHAAIAEALEDSPERERERYSLALAFHYKEAGNNPLAARWLTTGAQRALSTGALDDARNLLGEALELTPDSSTRAKAYTCLAEIRTRLSDNASAVELLKEAVGEWKQAGRSAEAADALAEQARLLAVMGEPEATKVMAVAREISSVNNIPARLLFNEAQVASLLGLARASDAASEALAAAEAEKDPELIALCSLELARIRTHNGQFREAEEFGQRARSVVLKDGLEHLVGQIFTTEALRDSHLGNNQSALAKLDDAKNRLVDGLSSHHVVELDMAKARILWQMGRPDDADRLARRTEFGRVTRGYGRVINVWAAIERGDESWARTFVDKWWDQVGADYRVLPSEELLLLPESPEGGQYAQLADAVLAAFSDNPTDADEDRARRYWELCAVGMREVWIQSTWLLLKSLLTRQRLKSATEVLINSGLVAEELRPLHRAFFLEIQGKVALLQDQQETGVQALREAQKVFESIDNSSDRARVLIALAPLSDEETAKNNLREALRLATEAGAIRYAHRAEASLRDRGIRPRAGRPKGSARKEGLSLREEEVVTLVASGATNAEIAARLFLSERTVQDHLARASRRLGLSGRAGLAAWAAKQGLV